MPNLPRSDEEFSNWVANFVTYATANAAALGLVAGDLTAITAKQTTWNTARAAHLAAVIAGHAARQAKDDSREDLTDEVRALTLKLQGTGQVSNEEAIALGLTVRDAPTPSTPPAQAPIVTVDTSVRLRHVIHFRDMATPESRAKPAGVIGCEIWGFVGEPLPEDPSGYRFLGTDTSSPYLMEYGGADAGKTAHYLLRWLTTRGEHGPWTAVVSATIPG